MPSILFRALPFALLVATVSGCSAHYGRDARSSRGHHHHHSDGVLVATGLILGAAVIASEVERSRERGRVVVVDETMYLRPRPTVFAVFPASPRDRVQPTESTTPFDAAAARTALASVDLGPCREAGAPRGYGHAQITYAGSGAITQVVVDAPSGLPPQAVACVGDRLGTATSSPFGGRDVTVATSWFIR